MMTHRVFLRFCITLAFQPRSALAVCCFATQLSLVEPARGLLWLFLPRTPTRVATYSQHTHTVTFLQVTSRSPVLVQIPMLQNDLRDKVNRGGLGNTVLCCEKCCHVNTVNLGLKLGCFLITLLGVVQT